MSSGWGATGSYGGPHVDPTHGRVRWHRLDGPHGTELERPPLGAHNSKEYDEQHGRFWYQRKEEWRPKLYTTIGKHARSKRLKRTIVRWVYNSPNFRRLKRDVYRKRWPQPDQLCARFFAEFCHKDFEKRTLLETAHTLPLYGVGCKFWRCKTQDGLDTKGQNFIPDTAQYKLRPIRGLLRGTYYHLGKPVRHGIATIAKSLGSWRYEFPKDGHPAVYRPSFPEMRARRLLEEQVGEP